MAFQDYSTTAAENETLGDGIYIGPNMARNDVRPALQQLAADGRDLYNIMLTSSIGLATTAGNLIFGTDLGQIADGVGNHMSVLRKFSGAGSSSGLYGRNEQIIGYGSTNIGKVRAVYYGAATETTGGTVDELEAAHFFTWVRGSANVAVAKTTEVHMVVGRDEEAADTAGTITTEAIYVNLAGITLGSTASIPKVTGFNCGEITSLTQVQNGYGFNCEHNQTTYGGGQFAGFRSQVRTATGSFSFLANTNSGTAAAPAVFTGKVGVGSTLPGVAWTPTWDFHVIGAATDYAAAIQNRSGANPYGLRLEFTAAAPNNTTQAFLDCIDTSGYRARIFANGNLVNANNSYGAISDRRMKTAIKDASPQLADIKALRVRKFRMKADGKNGAVQLGLIAQEVEKVSPGLVFEGDDGTKGVNYSVLYMKAVKALQELAAEFDALRQEVAQLKRGSK